MTQLFHYDWASVPLGLTSYDLFGLVPLNFPCVTFFRLSTQMSSQEMDSNHFMTQAVSRKVESIQLMTQVVFQGIDSESTHDLSRSPGIDSDRLMTRVTFQGIDSESTHGSSGSAGTDSNQLVTQSKNIWFWVNSWFSFGSYPFLVTWHKYAINKWYQHVTLI